MITGKLAADVRRTLEQTSRVLLAQRLGRDAKAPFAGGWSAMALAHAALDAALPGRGHAERVDRDLARAADALSRAAVPPILYGGFTGVAWVIEHLRGDPTSPEDPNEEVDAALEEFLSAAEWIHSYDLIGGLVGYGIYALERMARPSGARILSLVVEQLAAMAERSKQGITWRSRDEWVPAPWRTSTTSGYNLGLAHGVPGIIGVLGRAWQAGIAKRECAKLLDGAVAWLLAQELPKNSPSAFPSAIVPGEAPVPSRSAWCYGDPGIAASLLVAARATGESAWKRAALRIGARAATRAPDDCGVVDAGVCHGSAGLALIFARLAAASGDERFTKATRTWIARTLAMRRPKTGIAGWQSLGPPRGRRPSSKMKLTWQDDASFLTGTCGIAMALAASVTRGEPAWDRVLLIS